MEQKDNNIIEFPNKPVEENTSTEKVKEINPIEAYQGSQLFLKICNVQ